MKKLNVLSNLDVSLNVTMLEYIHSNIPASDAKACSIFAKVIAKGNLLINNAYIMNPRVVLQIYRID